MAKQQHKSTKQPLDTVFGPSVAKEAENREELRQTRPLGKNNFILMAIAAAMIIIGFLLMLGGGSTEAAFNPDIFSTRRIVIGPAITFIGFLFMGFAIIRKPSQN